jgi:drug/metabolite transporter (DMT)-like permease
VSYLYLLIASFFWGTSFVAGKFAFEGIDPVLVIMFRFLIASFFLFPIFLRNIKKVNFNLICLSFLIIPVTFLLQFIGLSYTSASSSAIIIGLEPLLIGFIGLIFWKIKFKTQDIIASILAFIGILIIIGQPELVNYFGVLLVFISAVIVSLWVHISKHIMKDLSPIDFTGTVMIIGTVLLLPLAGILTKDFSPEFTISNVSAVFYLGICCSLIATIMWNKGLSKVPANRGGLFLALEPIFGVSLSVLLLNDPFNLLSLVGFLLVVVPIITTSYLEFKKTNQLES